MAPEQSDQSRRAQCDFVSVFLCRGCREIWRNSSLGFAKWWIQKGGFGGCSPGTKTGTRVHSDVPPVPGPKTRTRVRSHVTPERKPERAYVRQNHPYTKPPLDLPVRIMVKFSECHVTKVLVSESNISQNSGRFKQRVNKQG